MCIVMGPHHTAEWHAQVLAMCRVEWRGWIGKADAEASPTTKDDMIKGQGSSDERRGPA